MFSRLQASAVNGPLFKFKAGKLNRDGKMLIADKRKGFVTIEKVYLLSVNFTKKIS